MNSNEVQRLVDPPRHGKTIVVMPAYNAENTVRLVYDDIPREHVDEILLVDDVSQDDTVRIARELGIEVIEHARNRGYGGNQKTCYEHALERGADFVVMLHPDHQYDARMIGPCLLYTSPSPRDKRQSRMPSSA